MTFMRDVASRLANPIQVTTVGFHGYLNAVDAALPHGIDYAMLVKMYGTDRSSLVMCLLCRESSKFDTNKGSLIWETLAFSYSILCEPMPLDVSDDLSNLVPPSSRAVHFG